MLIDRNEGMIEKAAKMLDRGENVFYVVGAAHMVGNDGIIAGLKDRGYTVTQLGGMKADEFTDVDGDYPTLFDVDIDEVATTTTTTEAEETTTPTNPFADSEYDYDLYLEMYEYFGGTTAPAQQQETERTNAYSSSNEKDDDDGYGGSGVFGKLA